MEDEAFIVTGENIELFHSDDKKDDEGTKEDQDGGKTIKDVFDSMTEEQRTAAYYVIGQALNNDADDDDDNEMCIRDRDRPFTGR